MADFPAVEQEVTLVVNQLARALLAELFPAAEIKQTEEKLSALCVLAVHQVLNIFKEAAGGPKEAQGGPKEAQGGPEEAAGGPEEAAGGPEEAAGGPEEAAGGPKEAQGGPKEAAGGDEAERSSGQTYVVVYRSAGAASECLLLSLQSHANPNAKDEVTTLRGDPAPSSPPLQADFPDHGYARPSSPPPGTGPVSATRSRKRRHSRRTKDTDTPPTAETGSHQQCSRCGMLFPSAERLSDHEKTAHPACSVCGAEFTGVLRLREHEIKEHGLLPYACDYCAKRFNHKTHRDLHVKARHTGEKSCHCDICGKGYACISVLKMHRMTHFDKTFICDVCGKSFYHACHLTRHKLVHQDVRPYRCDVCGKGFTQAANLRSHQAIHTGERQLCSICGKSYRCLKNHVISKHSHELPADGLPAADAIITCDVCDKKFPNLSQFKVHQRRHTGEKPFHCDVCGKSYRLKELLRDHRYTHTGEKPYRCGLCFKTFNLATSFMRHRSIHSGETPYSCHDCGKSFRLLTFLKVHLQTKAHLRQAQQRATSDL
ncbi:zinc finger protein 70 isoform X2 [Larimichthys crocea]|uniref:zinc finger protein 70 isoform X2 n=1 Tax=Larimichthys crocea TaxID=215358 RepID=UPI000F5E9154|nr:zinc finger protein 70 isoform X2 [Larimichthys crocea]